MYQQKMKIASKWIHWRTPILIKGENSLQQLPKVLEQNKQTRVLIVTDKGLSESGLLDTLCADLQCANIDYAIYDKTVPNPTVRNIG